MSYTLNLGQWNQIFAVPAAVVDSHIKLASESQLKVLLYLLRHAGEDISDDTVASALRISVEEVQNAVLFWKERELLKENGNELAPAEVTVQKPPVSAPAVTEKPAEPEKPKKPRTAVSRAQKPDSAFVAQILKDDHFLASLLDEVQVILKKPLSSGDTAAIVMLYHTFGLPCEVIALMVMYLCSVGEGNMRAIERMGIRWADEGIRTAADAEIEIERMTNSREAWERVSKLFGIRSVGKPTSSQLEHANRWLNEWGFSEEMILEAYERCVDNKGVYNIRYINAILLRWHEQGIKSLDTLQKEEKASKNKSKQKRKSSKGSMFSLDGASFDVNEYETDSLFDD